MNPSTRRTAFSMEASWYAKGTGMLWIFLSFRPAFKKYELLHIDNNIRPLSYLFSIYPLYLMQMSHSMSFTSNTIILFCEVFVI